MPTAKVKAHRRTGTEDRNRRLQMTEASFSSNSERLPRPRPTKLLMKVTIQGKVGAVHVVMSPELTVGDLIAAVLRQYMKEGRRLTIPSCDPEAFNLHYSQFILESLDKEEKLIDVGSRNFFLCPKSQSLAVPALIKLKATTPPPPPPPSSTCADLKATKTLFAPCLKFIDYLF